MIEVWYIRHGESEANAGLATDNPETIELTKLGKSQAFKVSNAFEKKPDLIVTSKYKRAMQTAQPTLQKFPNTSFEIWDVHEFTYLSPTKLQSTTQLERKPLSLSYWEKSDPSYVHGEGAESFESFINRVRNTHDKLKNIDDGFVAMFCHGFVIKAFLWSNMLGTFKASSEYMKNFYSFHKAFDFCNCGIVKAEYHADKNLYSGIITSHLN